MTRKISRCGFSRLITLLSTTLVPAIFAKPALDYSRLHVPLVAQVEARIRERIIAHIGESPLREDRYFLVPFGYQDRRNRAKMSHTFATVVRIDTARNVDHFTISWLPADFATNPNLCVFKGAGSSVFPRRNKCRPVVGKNFNLRETLGFARDAGNQVGMWGPYEITERFFNEGRTRKAFLESGKIKYIADDRLYRKTLEAINCFHATADLQVGFPRGGFLNTGLKIWGFQGTSHNLVEYVAKVPDWLKDPVRPDQDLYRFLPVKLEARRPRGRTKRSSTASAYYW